MSLPGLRSDAEEASVPGTSWSGARNRASRARGEGEKNLAASVQNKACSKRVHLEPWKPARALSAPLRILKGRRHLWHFLAGKEAQDVGHLKADVVAS